MNNLILSAALATIFSVSAWGADDATLRAGKQSYEYWCATCHGEGPGRPATQALEAKYKGAKPAVLDQRTDLTPPVIKAFVRKGVSIMPFFRKTELTDAQLDAVAAYVTRNSAAPGAAK